jgi:hypothetical protein
MQSKQKVPNHHAFHKAAEGQAGKEGPYTENSAVRGMLSTTGSRTSNIKL